jgi:hypothetical protein
MKKYYMNSFIIKQLKNYAILLLFILSFQALSAQKTEVPFSTDSNYLTVWNGKKYIPIFIKGVNLGVAKPGSYPGELDVKPEQYRQWFEEIKDAGFNCIRLYTLHFPQFYNELLNYNTNHPQHPLFFFQGVWLNEEMEGYKNDLYQITDTFRAEIRENIDCVHGNKLIAQRYGKAYGNYTADVSKWNIGYIVGREVYPEEILTTDSIHAGNNYFSGTHFEINNASPSEVWFTENLDLLVEYEKSTYNTERPVSISSWPTLDPLHHAFEPNRTEDTATVDLSKINILDAPAGLFISYHAYPYYPDFVGAQPDYKLATDNFGSNSYLGYIRDLKNHYRKYPLLIAEYGVPSSWGIAHYTSSGMNHGGFDEQQQGEADLRLLRNISSSQLAGGIQFAWIDEWFKKTWITDPIDFGNRILWHNITAAEQNFGLKKFVKSDEWKIWKNFDAADDITTLSAKQNYDFFEIQLNLKDKMDLLGECWIAIDTYDAGLGESMMPNGQTIPSRSEFLLKITQYAATLYVTEAYDLFGLWHKILTPKQKLRSVATDGAPWNIVRWKNNSFYSDVQYIGELKLNKSFQPETSKDAVTIYDDKISIRLPWTLLQFVDPSQKEVFHVDSLNPELRTRESDGIAVSIFYKNKTYFSDTRFDWEKWNKVTDNDVEEKFKSSYWTLYENLTEFNTPAIAFPDNYELEGEESIFKIDEYNGVLKNDFDMDGWNISAVLTDAPANGFVEINVDGSFSYIPRKGFKGTDVFKYAIFDGTSLSQNTTVTLHVKKEGKQNPDNKKFFSLFPNPASDIVSIKSEINIVSVRIFNYSGKLMEEFLLNDKTGTFNISHYPAGLYIAMIDVDGQLFTEKFIKK